MEAQNHILKAIVDTEAGYNLMDMATARFLNVKLERLPSNVCLQTISGGRLPIVAKMNIPIKYDQNVTNVSVFVSEYSLPFTILGREGLSKPFPGWKGIPITSYEKLNTLVHVMQPTEYMTTMISENIETKLNGLQEEIRELIQTLTKMSTHPYQTQKVLRNYQSAKYTIRNKQNQEKNVNTKLPTQANITLPNTGED